METPFALARHGGRLKEAQLAYPNAALPWVDLSTGINPRPYRLAQTSQLDLTKLPDPGLVAELESVAADAFGVADAGRVVAVSGSEQALRLLPIVVNKRFATILSPTYSSHFEAWHASGAHLEPCSIDTLWHSRRRNAATIVVNPNNPDGRVLTRDALIALHDDAYISDGYLIVDEAFIELVPSESVSDLAGSARAPALVVLRSFGKFFGLAGSRLGFAIAGPAVVNRLRHLVGDWPVTSSALELALGAYRDSDWAFQTRTWLEHEAQRLDRLLTNAGFGIVGGTSLFRLARHNRATEIFERMLSAGILARPFDFDTTLLRFGLPSSQGDWDRLKRALESV